MRKVMVLSFTFLELGQAALSAEWAWFTPVVVRTTMLQAVKGGWSAMLSIFLRRLLLSPAGGLLTAGAALPLEGRPTMLYARWIGGATRQPLCVHLVKSCACEGVQLA